MLHFSYDVSYRMWNLKVLGVGSLVPNYWPSCCFAQSAKALNLPHCLAQMPEAWDCTRTSSMAKKSLMGIKAKKFSRFVDLCPLRVYVNSLGCHKPSTVVGRLDSFASTFTVNSCATVHQFMKLKEGDNDQMFGFLAFQAPGHLDVWPRPLCLDLWDRHPWLRRGSVCSTQTGGAPRHSLRGPGRFRPEGPCGLPSRRTPRSFRTRRDQSGQDGISEFEFRWKLLWEGMW